MAYATVPAEIMTGSDIVTESRRVEIPTRDGPQQVAVPGLQKTPIPVYLTLLTSMFMHGGIAHLLGNMWFLWIFGDNIEKDMGRMRYLVFYVLCGILAALAHILLQLKWAFGLHTLSGCVWCDFGCHGSVSRSSSSTSGDSAPFPNRHASSRICRRWNLDSLSAGQRHTA